MLSDSCSFDEFVNTVEAENIFDLMYLTEKEATEAERWRYRTYVDPVRKKQCGLHYAETLKNFLFYMKYGIKPPGVNEQLYEIFKTTCDRFRN